MEDLPIPTTYLTGFVKRIITGRLQNHLKYTISKSYCEKISEVINGDIIKDALKEKTEKLIGRLELLETDKVKILKRLRPKYVKRGTSRLDKMVKAAKNQTRKAKDFLSSSAKSMKGKMGEAMKQITPEDRGYAKALKDTLKEKKYLDEDNDLIDLTGMNFRSLQDAKDYRKKRYAKHRDYYKKDDGIKLHADEFVGDDFDRARVNIIKRAEKRQSGGKPEEFKFGKLGALGPKDLIQHELDEFLEKLKNANLIPLTQDSSIKQAIDQDSPIKQAIDGEIQNVANEIEQKAKEVFEEFFDVEENTRSLRAIIKNSENIIYRALDRHFKDRIFNEFDLREAFMKGLEKTTHKMIKDESHMENILKNSFNKRSCKQRFEFS